MLGDSEAHVLLSPKTCKSGLEQVSWFIIVPLCLTTAKKAPPPLNPPQWFARCLALQAFKARIAARGFFTPHSRRTQACHS